MVVMNHALCNMKVIRSYTGIQSDYEHRLVRVNTVCSYSFSPFSGTSVTISSKILFLLVNNDERNLQALYIKITNTSK